MKRMLYLPILAGLSGGFMNANGDYMHYLLYALALLLVFEFIVFLLSEKITGTLSWKIIFKEVLKKLLLAGVVIISFIIDELMQTGDVVANSTLVFYIVNEMIYIIGLAVKAGVPLPDAIVKLIEKNNGAKHEKDESEP